LSLEPGKFQFSGMTFGEDLILRRIIPNFGGSSGAQVKTTDLIPAFLTGSRVVSKPTSHKETDRFPFVIAKRCGEFYNVCGYLKKEYNVRFRTKSSEKAV
jgi:hypothetical protein